ncbi:TfoX family protein [Fulvivirga sp. RKSG066]|uniref:TfoX/Sxy family protein n=1 Tax=Fulvivirga aurantia TaxID=2529383 RepID=UPI0012BCFE3F|nr:TfoX/Sxy family protein [Fulvivirga aurantia]MTI22906.1 TfoX family protein [Fulvivirga aurantia]
MAISADYLKYVEEQLSEFEGIDSKKMFGGIGFFKEGLMFGMLGGEVFRLKVDDQNKADYEKYGMKPYHSDKKKKGMPYWEVPEEILKDKRELKVWASKAFDAAQRAKK